MESSQPNFNLEFVDDSDDDNSLFITQTPREDREVDVVNVNDQSVEDLDIENLMESRMDSAIGSVASVDGGKSEDLGSVEPLDLNEKNKVSNVLESVKMPEKYQPEVEEIS